MLTREDKEKLMEELEEEFNRVKDELGFETSLDELDKSFFIRDMVLAYGFVPPSFISTISHRIKDRFYQHVSQIHRMLVPSPYSMMESAEHDMLSDDEKKELDILMKRYLQKTVECGLVLMKDDKDGQAKFIDGSFSLYKETLPIMIRYQEKTNELWKDEADKAKKS
ncbi:MAG: hypothetical protein ACLFNK_00910 [Candidatus Woesearchaeota archaeon]